MNCIILDTATILPICLAEYKLYLIPTGFVYQYDTSVGVCRGGDSPENGAGQTKYYDSLCKSRCSGDSTCTGFATGGSMCATYFSVGAVGYGNPAYTCFMKTGWMQFRIYNVLNLILDANQFLGYVR